jgi:transposase-like protein
MPFSSIKVLSRPGSIFAAFLFMAYSPKLCTNALCLHHTHLGGSFIKKGFFCIKHNHQKVRRFQCKACKKTLSSRSFSATYRQKKPFVNALVFQLHCEGVPMRGIARTLRLSCGTVDRKFHWLFQYFSSLKLPRSSHVETLYFDELETIEHTKLKPLSIAVFVDQDYKLLVAEVAEMPAKGRLALISRTKYGAREDLREPAMEKCFDQIKGLRPLKIVSDAKPSYKKYVDRYFPKVAYEIHNQAEKERKRDRLHENYQKKAYDPLFPINQRFAKLRADIRRLTRRSWCTTKLKENLQKHLELYRVYNNLGYKEAVKLLS